MDFNDEDEPLRNSDQFDDHKNDIKNNNRDETYLKKGTIFLARVSAVRKPWE